MNLKEFKIKNFRCFTDEQTLKFAIPVEEKVGSGLTYILGKNNTGKTTLIEGIWIYKDQKIRSSEKRNGLNAAFELYGHDGNLIRKVFIPEERTYTLSEEPSFDRSKLFEIISSRRHWDSIASSNSTSQALIEETTRGNNPRQTQSAQTASMLRDFEKDQKKYREFTTLVQKIIPEFTEWAVAYEDHEFIEYKSKDGVRHKTDFLGDGVISIIRILAHLYENRDSGLIIDEPELSLHPSAQKNLVKIIAEFAKKRQIVLCTHSPYFINWKYLQNGAVVNRLTKIDDTNAKIYTLNDISEYENLIKAENWQQPYLMDIAAKEIFFLDNVLFLEGQEDVGLLRTQFDDSQISLFGYGVRGYSNFEFAVKLAKDIGIKKICVLLDYPSDINNKPNEITVKENLESTYGHAVKVILWNKNDIRDKPALKQIPHEKSGYFTVNGKLKNREELDDFDEKINMIKSYFQ